MGARVGHRAAAATTLRAVAAGAIVLSVLSATPDAAAEEFRPGEAEASADTFALAIKQGNANIGFTYGSSMAGYRDRTASAEGRALDLGVLPTLFAVEQCDGSRPPMNPDTLPPITRVDSTEPDAGSPRRTEVHLPGTDGGPHGASAGFQDAAASPKPASRATTESVDTDVFLLALEGGRTDVSTKLEGQVRQARAVSTADELRIFGGLFTFTRPRWEATALSGATEVAEGSFTFEEATVLGEPRTVDEALADFRSFEDGLEQLLHPLGVEIDLPAVEISEGRVQVTPMAFRLVDPPFGAQVLAPFFGSVQSQREAAAQRLVDEDCKNALAITLIDMVLGVAAGSGAIEVLAGGVDVFTADTDFSVEPLEPLPALPLVESPPLDVAPTDLPPQLDVAPVPVLELAEPVAVTVPEEAEVAGTPRRRDSEQAFAPAASSRFEDSAAGAAAVAVGIAGLLGAFGLAFGERALVLRNNRRRAG